MATFEQMKEYIMDDIMTWGAFAAIAVILIGLVCIMPRGKVMVWIEGVLVVIGTAAVLIAPMILDIVGGMLDMELIEGEVVLMDHLFKSGYTSYMLMGLILALLLGTFTGGSYMTQGLYGVLVAICMPYGLINILFPVWTNAGSVAELFADPIAVTNLLVYTTLFFVPLWLIRTGCYKLRITSFWHAGTAVVFGISAMLFLAAAELVVTPRALLLMSLLEWEEIPEPVMEQVIDSAINLAVFAGVILVFSLVITIFRKMIFGAKATPFFSSDSAGGFIVRVIGRLVAIGGGAVLGLLLPGMMNYPEGVTGALVYLAPIGAFIIVLFITELIADIIDVKVSMRKYNRSIASDEAYAPAAAY